MGRRFKVNQATVGGHLLAIAKKGYLEKLSDGRWGVRSSELREAPPVPVYGSIPAGVPAMREQAPEEMIAIDPATFGARSAGSNGFWFLRVTGDSMEGARIFDGDLVALDRREPRSGDIIAALIDENETTLKYLVREGGRTYLRAANPKYPDIAPLRLESQGVVVGVLRRYAA